MDERAMGATLRKDRLDQFIQIVKDYNLHLVTAKYLRKVYCTLSKEEIAKVHEILSV